MTRRDDVGPKNRRHVSLVVVMRIKRAFDFLCSKTPIRPDGCTVERNNFVLEQIQPVDLCILIK